MSKVRINDLAREMEVKSRQILDILTELGLDAARRTPVRWRTTRPIRCAINSSSALGPQAREPATSRSPQRLRPNRPLAYLQARRRAKGDTGQEAGRRVGGAPRPSARESPPRSRAAAQAPARPAPPVAVAPPPPARRLARNRARSFLSPAPHRRLSLRRRRRPPSPRVRLPDPWLPRLRQPRNRAASGCRLCATRSRGGQAASRPGCRETAADAPVSRPSRKPPTGFCAWSPSPRLKSR